MKRPHQSPPPKAKPKLKLTRKQLVVEEMRRSIEEYDDDLRELIRK